MGILGALAAVLTVALHAAPAPGGLPIIFGKDDRKDVQDGSPEEKRWAAASPAIIPPDGVYFVSGRAERRIHFKTVPYTTAPSAQKLCKNAPFYGQPRLQQACSSALIGPRMIMTAGHCAERFACSSEATDPQKPDSQNKKKYAPWIVFGFAKTGEGVPASLPADSAYRCVKKEYRWEGDRDGMPTEDWALVLLDRDVPGAAPLEIDEAGFKDGDALVSVGYPEGLAAKITGGAKVVRTEGALYRANLDIESGSSGGPVIHPATGKIGGIAVGGVGGAYEMKELENCVMLLQVPDDPGSKSESYSGISSSKQFLEAYRRLKKEWAPAPPPRAEGKPLEAGPALKQLESLKSSSP